MPTEPNPDKDGQIKPGTLLSDCPTRQVGTTLPVVLSNRLDLLVKAAERGGIETSRKELVAMLILNARGNASSLARQIKSYRRTTAAIAVLHGLDEETLTLRQPRRGPRPRGLKR